MAGSEVIFEFVRVGNYLKVSAVDTATNIEVSIVGSPRMDPDALRHAALQKLRYVLRKSDEDGRRE